MSAMASQITILTIVYSTVYSGADQRQQQSSASLAFVRWIHRSPGNSPHKGPVTRKMFPLDDVIMEFTVYIGDQFWAFRYCRCPGPSVRVREPRVCPRHHSSPIHARITTREPEVQSTLVKIPIVLWGDCPWPSRSNLSRILPHFEAVRTKSLGDSS